MMKFIEMNIYELLESIKGWGEELLVALYLI